MKLRGIIVPTLTPMNATGDVLNLDAVKPMVDFLVAQGMAGLFVNGTTGEAPLLRPEERRQLVEAFVAAAGGRIPVVVQVGAATTRESVAHARHAEVAGADAIACISPWFFAYTDAELEHHFLQVARAVPEMDMYLYTLPVRTGNTISLALVERLAHEPNIVGIKDSSGDAEQLRKYLEIPTFGVLCGDDTLARIALDAGAAGTVSGPAGFIPEIYRAFWNGWSARDRGAVGYWHELLLKVLPFVDYGRRLDVLKHLTGRRLSDLGSVRPPVSQATADTLATLREQLHDLLKHSRLDEAAYRWLR